MFDTVIIEVPVGPDPNEVSSIMAAVNGNQDDGQRPQSSEFLERLDPRWMVKKKNRQK
ncbi:MAG: hypothetical protein WAL56_24150 [Candidatus Sulfotelmatobacter sp.]